MSDVVTHAIMGWLVRGRRPEGSLLGEGAWRLSYGARSTIALLALASIFPALGGAVLTGRLPMANDGSAPLALVVIGGAVVMSVLLAADVLVASVLVSSDGLDFRYPWRPSAFVPWSEVRSVTYSPGMYWFPVKTDRGTFRISELRDGLGTLREHLERHTRPEVWADAASTLP